MDVVKGYSIAFRGLRIGEYDYDFKVGRELFEAYGNTEIKDGACDVRVRLTRSESMLLLRVAIEGSVVVECDRCLEECTLPVHYEGELPVRFSEEEHEYDGEVLWLMPGEDEVDLAQYIYESVVLSLPYRRVHPDGECNPDMLGRFSIVTEEAFDRLEREAGARAGECSEWDKLAALKTRMERGAEEENKENK